jgi:hypothetical protein
MSSVLSFDFLRCRDQHPLNRSPSLTTVEGATPNWGVCVTRDTFILWTNVPLRYEYMALGHVLINRDCFGNRWLPQTRRSARDVQRSSAAVATSREGHCRVAHRVVQGDASAVSGEAETQKAYALLGVSPAQPPVEVLQAAE